MHTILRPLAALALGVGLAGGALAAPTVYTDPSAFMAQTWAAGSPATVGFDGAADGTAIGDGGSFDGLTFHYSTLAGHGVTLNVVTDSVNVSGSNVLGTDDGGLLQDGDEFDLDFGASNAIGMYFITDSFGGMFDGDITLSAGGATAELLTADLITTIDNLYEVYFLGIVDTAATFTSASVGNIGGGFFTYTVDDITTGLTTTANNAVPLPGTLALVVGGLLAWLPLRRR